MSNEGGTPQVPAADVPGGVYLLDVREDDEWAAGHVPGAVHVPLGMLGEQAGEIPRDQDVYVICRSGHRSGQAATALNASGWRALNVAGGMRGWQAAGRDMVSDSGGPPAVI
jgi:rhodanese-related sulfurtransferase